MMIDSPSAANVGVRYEVGPINQDYHPYRCHLAILREDDDTFSVVVLNLPGAGSCGESEEEAIANTREAIAGVIESYKASNADIPWEIEYEIPEGAKSKWILVNG